MKLIKVSIISILSIVFITCREKNISNNKAPQKYILHDTLIREYSTYFESSFFNEFFPSEIQFLGLEDLRRGYNDKEIRIWLEYVESDSAQVLIFKRQNDSWESFCYYLNFKNDKVEGNSIDSKIVKGVPTSGWDDFIFKIDSIGLENLRNYSQINGYERCTEGDVVAIEIAQKNKYRIFCYPCYNIYNLKNAPLEIRKTMEILSLIQKEFRYNLSKINNLFIDKNK